MLTPAQSQHFATELVNVYFYGGLVYTSPAQVEAATDRLALLLHLSKVFGAYHVVSTLEHVDERHKGLQYSQIIGRLFQRGVWTARNVPTWRPLIYDLAVQFRAAAEVLLRQAIEGPPLTWQGRDVRLAE